LLEEWELIIITAN